MKVSFDKVFWILFFFGVSCEPNGLERNKEALLLLNFLSPQSSSTAQVTCPLPTSTSGTFLANIVVSSPGSDTNSIFGDPAKAVNGVCGGGEFQGSTDVYSLNPPNRNQLTLSWNGRRVLNESGIDFIIFENPFKYVEKNGHFIEPTIVEVSEDNSVFCGWNPRYTGANTSEVELIQRTNWPGFAGKNPVFWNQLTNALSPNSIFSNFDSFNASVTAGGDGFDLEALSSNKCSNSAVASLQRNGFLFVRLTSGISEAQNLGITIPPGNSSGGPDIDGVLARSIQN